MSKRRLLLLTEPMPECYKAWQRPTLAGGNPQLPSALRSLTSVFGMGTGVSFLPSLPHLLNSTLFLSWLNPQPAYLFPHYKNKKDTSNVS